MLVNPATGDTTEPRGGYGAPRGACSYDDYQEWDRDLDRYVPAGYYIQGRGVYGLYVVTDFQNSFLQKERKVIEHCLLVRYAVESFVVDNKGEYPWNVAADITPRGNTVIDYLPEGELLVNPFSGARDSPVTGPAANPGQIGYQVRDHNHDGVWDGYQIDALGALGPVALPICALEHPNE